MRDQILTLVARKAGFYLSRHENSPFRCLKQQSDKIRVFLLSGACGEKDFSYNAHPVPMKNFVPFTIVTPGGNSSVGRARPCQGRGREFESRFPLQKFQRPCCSLLAECFKHINAGIAQLVEHDLAKVGVASSSLVSRSNFISSLHSILRRFRCDFRSVIHTQKICCEQSYPQFLYIIPSVQNCNVAQMKFISH